MVPNLVGAVTTFLALRSFASPYLNFGASASKQIVFTRATVAGNISVLAKVITSLHYTHYGMGSGLLVAMNKSVAQDVNFNLKI